MSDDKKNQFDPTLRLKICREVDAIILGTNALGWMAYRLGGIGGFFASRNTGDETVTALAIDHFNRLSETRAGLEELMNDIGDYASNGDSTDQLDDDATRAAFDMIRAARAGEDYDDHMVSDKNQRP